MNRIASINSVTHIYQIVVTYMQSNNRYTAIAVVYHSTTKESLSPSRNYAATHNTNQQNNHKQTTFKRQILSIDLFNWLFYIICILLCFEGGFLSDIPLMIVVAFFANLNQVVPMYLCVQCSLEYCPDKSILGYVFEW